MNRIPSPLTLQLVRAMAADPASPEAMRTFHRNRLDDLEKRAASARRDVRESPFSRFEKSLETKPEIP